MPTIPAGVIPERVPKPLTHEQRYKARAGCGGDATPEQLAELVTAFLKPGRNHR